jgi:hypothetical protein
LRKLFGLLPLLAVGCITIEDKGLTPDTILELEQDRWGQRQGVVEWPDEARHMGVPLDAKPIGVRNVDCDWRGALKYFDCEYDVEWISQAERSSGFYGRRFQSIGKDENGDWVELIVVT